MQPSTAFLAPRILPLKSAALRPSITPTSEELMTTVGPPDWPMTALPLRDAMGFLGGGRMGKGGAILGRKDCAGCGTTSLRQQSLRHRLLRAFELRQGVG